MHSHTQHRTPHYIHNTWHHSPNSPFCYVPWIACVVLVFVLCVFCVRVVISLVVFPLVSVVLSLLRCVSVFCASCAFWCTHQHMVIVCRVCVVCVFGSAVSQLLEHVIRSQSSAFHEHVRCLNVVVSLLRCCRLVMFFVGGCRHVVVVMLVSCDTLSVARKHSPRHFH